jgi:hypothetical protein
VSISLLGNAPSFLGEFSHDTKVVAPSLSFATVLKSWYLVLFSWRKMQKRKKNVALRKIFYLISPQREHFRTKFKRILEAMFQGYNFRFLTILGSWSCDHPPQMDPDMYHHSYLSLFHFLDISNDITFFEYTLKAIPDILYAIPMFIIFWLFLAQWNKYPPPQGNEKNPG